VKRPQIKRPTRLLERQWPWLLIALVIALALAGTTAALGLGIFDGVDPFWFGRNFRGYTAGGLAMGVLATVLAFASAAYSIRKRRAAAGSTSMMTWLWVHVYLGLLAVLAAVLHAGFGLVSFNLSTGKVLLLVFAIIALSGIAWRLAYAYVPGLAAPRILNYSEQGAQQRASEQKTEIEKIAAGKSPEFHRWKEALLAREMSQGELGNAAQTIRPEDRQALGEVAALAASRHRALRRIVLQARYTRWLQRWRWLHVPMALLFAAVLVAHVVGALGLAKRALPIAGGATTGPLAAYRPSEECRECHTAIYDSWANSMHAHALTSPVTIVQNNIDMKTSLVGASSPDPRRICINCHAPVAAAIVAGDTLPLEGGRAANEGIGCVACHQHRAPVPPGSGGLASDFQAKLEKGDTYFGGLASPVGNALHKSDMAPSYGDPAALCGGCHDVSLDRDGDGKIVKGVDLVLQTTFDEFKDYVSAGGQGSCVTCHMPALSGVTAAADGAWIPVQQDFEGPKREVHDHSFVGVDYPLDTVARSDPQRDARAALLRGAAQLSLDDVKIEGNTLKVVVTLENETGHNLPTGFAFARQMWIELVAADSDRQEFFASGKLARPTDDLCDNATYGETDNPLRPQVVGCSDVDKQLVNVQLKLVDKITVLADASGAPSKNDEGEYIVIQAKSGNETFLQYLTGGPVVRVRPVDKTSLAPLRPRAKKAFTFSIPLGRARSGVVSARLLFRNLPPYFLRAMGKAEPAEGPRMDALVANLQVVEMAKKTARFSR
jgi:hypothetical protein